MPATSTTPSPTNNASSFIGLESYTEAQVDNFFGRDKEIESLTKLVEANTLTIIFGKSGTGKTSLLNAGVFPKLRKEYCLPFRIRLEFRDDSPDLVAQIKKVLKEEIDKYGFSVEAYPANETLWEYFHKEPLWSAVTPILVFDQFEEIFTLAKKNERFGILEQAIFWEELADLIENSIPEKLKELFLNNKEQVDYNYRTQKTKILFSFREEFLPEFETITSKIPSIKFSRFRLLPMNGHQAYEVITKTWKEDINPAEAKQVVSFFTYDNNNNESYDLITVEPALLSQVCSYIDRERITEGTKKVSAELLKKYPKDKILRCIYEEAIDESNRALNRQGESAEMLMRNPVKEFVEEKMITTEGYRTTYSLSEKDTYILPGVDVLINKYLIREDDDKVELTHDILAPIIKTDREKRRKETALATERKKARRKALVILLAALLTGGGFWFIATIQRNNAIHERDEAIEQNANTQLKTDSLQKQFTLDSIKLSRMNKGKKGGYFVQGDTSTHLFNELYMKDSIELVNLRSTYSGLEQELKYKTYKLDSMRIMFDKTSLEFLNKSRLSESSYREAMNTMLKLRGMIAEDSTELVLSKRALTALTIRFNNLKDLYDALLEKKYPKPVAVDTNFNLKLDLHYASQKARSRPPSNLTIFLIPDSAANRKIIRRAKLYEIHCDDNTLRKTSNFKVATFYNGSYGFAGVPKGKYFIKICAYYGGYYTFTKTSEQMQELTWDVSPPIQ